VKEEGSDVSKMRETNMPRCCRAGLAVFGLAAAANAATFQYSWEGGEPPTLYIGESANLNVEVSLGQLPTPPFTKDEFGFLLYVLSDFQFNNLGHILEPTAYVNWLEPDYAYTNIPYPPPAGLTGTQVAHVGPGPMKTTDNTGVLPFLVSTITITALPCPDTATPDEVFIFVGDPSSDLAMFRGDLITAVPITNNTPAGVSLTHMCAPVPEPASLALIALGSLVTLRRRR